MSDSTSIEVKAMERLLSPLAQPYLVQVSTPGSSGARVSIFRDSRTGFLYAVKCVQNPRISLIEEQARRELLTPYLKEHLPRVLFCQIIDGHEVMVTECKGTDTLHNLLTKSASKTDEYLPIWEEVLQNLIDMWKETQHEYVEALSPRHFPSRIKRIEEGVQNAVFENIRLADYWDLPIQINGETYPSLRNSFEKISMVGSPSFGVLCQGDPQPSNIVVTPGRSWYWVDWEWSGYHQDWRMMASHLMGWWSSRCLEILAPSSIMVTSTHIELSYHAHTPSCLHEYQAATLTVPEKLVGETRAKESVSDINRYLSALYFGEIRFLKLWGREDFFVPMLAQAVTTANDQGQRADHADFQYTY